MTSSLSQLLLAIFFITAGILHFVFPAQYVSIIPPWLPQHGLLVVVSGVCEIAGGIGVLFAGTRRTTGIGLILLSLAVLPANLQMLLDALTSGEATWMLALLWLRLPLQLILIVWIWRTTKTQPHPVQPL